MAKKYVMLADITRCINCKSCVVACRAEWGTLLGYSRDWVKEVEFARADGSPQVMLFPGRCQHCDDAPCVEACPSGAAYKRDDGVVLVDEEICSGCELCVPACPYEARWLNPATRTIGKCTFCQPRIDQGLQPACVKTCVGGALKFGDANDPGSEVSRLLREHEWVRLATEEVNVGPNHYYYTAGVPVPADVLPRLHEKRLAARLMGNVVNPVAKVGIGGMMATFLAAGLMKIIGRRQQVAAREHSKGDE